MSKPKTKSKLSVQEFQTWLQGIMEFQSADWSPNAEQWAAIFDKIMNLKSDDTVTTTNISAVSIRKIEDMLENKLRNFNNAPQVAEHYDQRPPRSQQPTPGLFDDAQENPTQPTQPAPGGLAPGQELISAEEFQQLSQEEIDAKIAAAKEGLNTSISSTQVRHKTPNVDSTQGYSSSFG